MLSPRPQASVPMCMAALLWLPLLMPAGGCGPAAIPVRPALRPAPPQAEPPPPSPQQTEPPPPEAAVTVTAAPAPPQYVPVARAAEGQVARWRAGDQEALIERRAAIAQGLFLLDVGRAWVPLPFRSVPGMPHAYQARFVALANGRFDEETAEGRRAKLDRYLELYGILPAPALLAERLRALGPCASAPIPAALSGFGGVAWDEDGDEPAMPVAPEVVEAIQERLRCAGHLRNTPDGLDLRTRRALEEFERRHRIYARGSLDGETLVTLKRMPAELERRALLRVLTERLVLDLGLIEDGSAAAARAHGADATLPVEPAPDLVSEIQRRLEVALGLGTVAGLEKFYAELGGALDADHYTLAIDPLALPDYHSPHMDLFAEIDRGDVYYDFPYDEAGAPREQPVEHRPTLTLFTRSAGRVVPLAAYGTTVGSWRIQRQGGRDFFAYKESPVGPRAWTRIESAPVWMPPTKTPPASLVLQTRRTHGDDLVREVNENLVGPGYASAYGLLAAYHRVVGHTAGGDLRIGPDEGIRTHGSSDYTSVWRRASLGCHRLHNHRAMRLFNFILHHRRHTRTGHKPMRFSMPVVLEDFSAEISLSRTGYRFELTPPLPVEVLAGRILGARKRKSDKRVPVERVLGMSAH